jgi:hypothetical protein
MRATTEAEQEKLKSALAREVLAELPEQVMWKLKNNLIFPTLHFYGR